MFYFPADYEGEKGYPTPEDYREGRCGDDETGPEPNYVHEPCGTEIHIDGGHKHTEYAWCDQAGSVVRFTRIDN